MRKIHTTTVTIFVLKHELSYDDYNIDACVFLFKFFESYIIERLLDST